MFLKVIRDFSRPHWFDILSLIKGSTGLSVAELSKSLKMSYMGVKQHCLELEKRGYLDTWRRPKPVGRPEKAYRITKKADALFPKIGIQFTLDILDSVKTIYGAAAPEKLIFNFFQEQGERYAMRLKGKTVAERANSLAKLRDSEGYRSTCNFDRETGLNILEYHSLVADIARAYPTVHRMEEAMFGKVLKTGVTRTEEAASGLSKTTFSIATL